MVTSSNNIHVCGVVNREFIIISKSMLGSFHLQMYKKILLKGKSYNNLKVFLF